MKIFKTSLSGTYVGHSWNFATNGAHWSMQQFSWYPCVLPLKGPTWGPHETHVCLPSVLPMLGWCVITIMGLPLMGHTGVCNTFPWGVEGVVGGGGGGGGVGADVFRLKVPIWDPYKTHVCLLSTLPILSPSMITFLGQCKLLLEGPCDLSLEAPTSQVIKMVSPAGVQW